MKTFRIMMAASALLTLATAALADILAIDASTVDTTTAPYGVGGYTRAYDFSPDVPMTVTDLGVYTTDDILLIPATVEIFDLNVGPTAVVASATIPAGVNGTPIASTPASFLHLVPVTSADLIQGGSYGIHWISLFNDQLNISDPSSNNSDVTVNGITVGESYWAEDPGNTGQIGTYQNQHVDGAGGLPHPTFAGATLMYDVGALPQENKWLRSGVGAWSEDANWSTSEFGSGAPNDNTRIALFGDSITSNQTVSVNTDVTVKSVQFDNPNSYAIAGPGSITLDADTGNASVSVAGGATAGDHQFQVAVSLADNTDVDVGSGASLVFNNSLGLGGFTLTKTGPGTISINNRLHSGGGTLDCSEGTCSGNGTLGGNLNNSGGTVSPGSSPGVMGVAGDFNQSEHGTLLIELAGTAPETEHDLLDVGGVAYLDGRLEVALLSDFLPQTGDSFDIFDFNVLSGAFGEISLPELANGLAWDTSLLYADGILAVVPEPSTILLLVTASVLMMQARRRRDAKMK